MKEFLLEGFRSRYRSIRAARWRAAARRGEYGRRSKESYLSMLSSMQSIDWTATMHAVKNPNRDRPTIWIDLLRRSPIFVRLISAFMRSMPVPPTNRSACAAEPQTLMSVFFSCSSRG